MDLDGKQENLIKKFNQLTQQITQGEDQVQQLKASREQVRGQVALVQEMQQEEQAPVEGTVLEQGEPVVDNPAPEVQ